MPDGTTGDDIAIALESVPTPPGVRTRRVGPLDLPVPMPDVDFVTNQDKSNVGESNRNEPESAGSPGDGSDGKPLAEVVEYGENYLHRVEEAIEGEDCSICRSILRSLRGEDIERQVKGVRELAELKRRVGEGADADELVEVMDDFDVIGEVDQYL